MSQSSLYNLGNTAFRQGKFEEALKYYNEALNLEPADADTKHNLDLVKRGLEK